MRQIRWQLLLLTLAGGCGTGRLIPSDTPPSPEPAEPTAVAEPAPAPAPAPNPSPAPPTEPVSPQGYAPYGEGSTLELRRLGQWTHSGIGESRRLVIRDANSFAAFWSELGAGDRPQVDFTRYLVIAAAAGQQPTGGYGVTVSKVSLSGGDLTAEVVEQSPGPNCVTPQVVTQPVDVVVVPAAGVKGWSFVERKAVGDCGGGKAG